MDKYDKYGVLFVKQLTLKKSSNVLSHLASNHV